ncbi:MAG: hypothetical protein BA864_01290 [Desulfuromonadales bacterium C00003093]|nr:MAG: hypothetical protein BA864_01290 [Desulfuromonadales bacterium C00003093]
MSHGNPGNQFNGMPIKGILPGGFPEDSAESDGILGSVEIAKAPDMKNIGGLCLSQFSQFSSGNGSFPRFHMKT